MNTDKRRFSFYLIALFFIFFFAISMMARAEEFITDDEGKISPEQLADKDGKFIDVKGLKVYYKEKGSKGKVLLFIHGFSASTWSWRLNMEPLSKDFHVYALDLKGFGYTAKPKDSDYTLNAQAKLVADFMDALKIKSATLIGNSMGGAISMKVALNFPDKVEKLVLVDSAGVSEGIVMFGVLGKNISTNSLSKTLNSLFMNEHIIKSIIKSLYMHKELKTDEVAEGYVKPFRTPGIEDAFAEMVKGFVSDDDLPKRIPEIKIPTLIVWGEDDTIIPVSAAHKFNELIKGSKLITYPQAGHMPMEEHPAEFNKAIAEFVNK